MFIQCANPKCEGSQKRGTYVERIFTACGICGKSFAEQGIDLHDLYIALYAADDYRDRLLFKSKIVGVILFTVSWFIWDLPIPYLVGIAYVMLHCVILRDNLSIKWAREKFPKVTAFLDWPS